MTPAIMAVENAEIARLLRRMGDVLEVEGANPFRVRAYRTAARTVESLPQSVDALARVAPDALTELPGIGEDLAGKIVEIVTTGHLAALRAEEARTPEGAIELMRIPGIGPKRARALCDTLHVRTIAGLRRAARAGRIHDLRGFGERTEQRILESLDVHAAASTRVLRATAAQYAEPLVAFLRALPGVEHAELAGSYRRCRETVGDLDLLVASDDSAPVIDAFVDYPEVREVLARGTTRAAVRLRSGLQVDLRVLTAESFGAGMHYFTGSKAHNIAVRTMGRARGLRISEYGVFRGARRVGGRSETEVFHAVGLPDIPPELREDRGEIEAAREGRLPRLVTLGDIRGDLQVHTTDSDGRDTLEAMARAAQERGYEYLAITDHTPAVRVAGGLDRAGFRRQARRIDRLNAALQGLVILKGAEVDILEDGALDLDDETLAALDLVVVSLHSHFRLGSAAQTERLLRAITHPAVDILAHPTARMIGRREPAAFDHEAVFATAAAHGVMIEVNAQPERLDLDDVASRTATAAGALLVVNTDAHAAAELDFMRWGVDQARRGWVERGQVANTRPLAQLQRLLHGAR